MWTLTTRARLPQLATGDGPAALFQPRPLWRPAAASPRPPAAAGARVWPCPDSSGAPLHSGHTPQWCAHSRVTVISAGVGTSGGDGAGGGGWAGGGGGWHGGGADEEEPDSDGPFNGRGGIPIFLLCVAGGIVIAVATTVTAPGIALNAAPRSGPGPSASSSPNTAAAVAGKDGSPLSRLLSLLSKGPTSPGGANGSGSASQGPPPSVSVIVPVLNEAQGIRDTLRHLKSLDPPPSEIIVADGGSSDGTVWAAALEGARVVRSPQRGRGRQMNCGAEVARGDILVFVHADSRPPKALVPTVRAVLKNSRVVLGGFNTLIELPDKVLWYMTCLNFVKTYCAPLLFRPLSFVRGLRLLFGDQTMFCRAADFRRVGGFDRRLPIMEDADLCLRMHMAGPGSGLRGRGHMALVLQPLNHTSGRRLGRLGNLRGTYAAACISLHWYLGAPPERLWELYRELWSERVR